MNSIIKFLLISSFIFLLSVPALAVPAAPSSLCEIEATVKKIQYNSADYQKLILKVNKIRAVKEAGINLCNDEYIQIIEKDGALFYIGDSPAKSLTDGEKIKANIQFGGDEKLHGNFIKNVEVINTANTDNIDNGNSTILKKENKNFWFAIRCFFMNLFGKDC